MDNTAGNLADPSELSKLMAHSGHSLLDFSPLGILKLVISMVCGVFAMFFLKSGKQDQDVERMVWGLILAIISIFIVW